MMLRAFAHLLHADTKWVLNTAAALRLPKRYSVELAKRVAVMRVIHDATGIPLARAWVCANRALRDWQGETAPVSMPAGSDGSVAVSVDLHRILSSFHVRLASLRTSFAPRQRGRRPSRQRDALQAAADWGIDLTLVADNLDKTPEMRLRQLDAMSGFSRDVRRGTDSAR